MQFDCLNFQHSPQTLQFQQPYFNVSKVCMGIVCNICGEPSPLRTAQSTKPDQPTRRHSASDPLQRLPPHRDLSDDQHAISVHNVPSSPSLTPQPPHRTTLRSNRSPLRPKHPISDTFCRSGLHFEQPAGGATIDPRHAGDTSPNASYGRNSPQTDREDEPQHHKKWMTAC